MHNHYVVNKDEYIYIYVMYNVLSGLAACGRLGVAARPACLFVTRSGTRPVARDQRHALARRQQTESVECY